MVHVTNKQRIMTIKHHNHGQNQPEENDFVGLILFLWVVWMCLVGEKDKKGRVFGVFNVGLGQWREGFDDLFEVQ